MPPASPHAGEPANNPELRQIRKDRADGSDLAGFRDSIENGLDAIEVAT
jgi:hypothetical protein